MARPCALLILAVIACTLCLSGWPLTAGAADNATANAAGKAVTVDHANASAASGSSSGHAPHNATVAGVS
ncbi:MAG: hypothetical protein ACREQN_14515, partial [Candidatus Binataceae bacterium]